MQRYGNESSIANDLVAGLLVVGELMVH